MIWACISFGQQWNPRQERRYETFDSTTLWAFTRSTVEIPKGHRARARKKTSGYQLDRKSKPSYPTLGPSSSWRSSDR